MPSREPTVTRARAHHRRAAFRRRQDDGDAGAAGGAARGAASSCARRKPGPITSIRRSMPRSTGAASVNLDSWAMPATLLDALAAQAARRRRYLRHRRRHGPVRRRSRRERRPARRDRRSRRAFRLAGRARARCRAPGAVGGGTGARLCRARSGRAHRRRHPQSRRQRTAPRARRRRDCRARHSGPRRGAARSRRSHCPSAISASFRPASMPTSPP